MLDLIKEYIDNKAIEHIAAARKSGSELYSALCDVANGGCYKRFLELVGDDGKIPDELLASLLMK